ncbi:MAG: hypothetical protein Q7S21_02620 [archaeon]|nr:hypothetical protein [archaeon]
MNKILKQAISKMRKLETVEAIAIVGSHTRKPKQNPHNIDFIIINTKKLTPKKLQEITMGKKSANFATISCDAIQFNYFGTVLSFVQLTPKQINSMLKKIISESGIAKKNRKWCIGWWVPEAFCGDIALCKILFDKSGNLSRWKKILSKYPQKLQKNILLNSKYVFKKKIKKYLTEKNEAKRNLALSEAIFEALRISFAKNKEYFFGIQI